MSERAIEEGTDAERDRDRSGGPGKDIGGNANEGGRRKTCIGILVFLQMVNSF